MTPSSKSVSDGVCLDCCPYKNPDCPKCHVNCQPQQEKCEDFKNGSCAHYCGDADPCPVLGPKGYPLPEDLKNPVRIEINPPQQEPMNQDNQVSWQILLIKLFRLHGYAALAGADTKIGQHIETAISLIERHIAQVSKDSYADGIRRAREVVGYSGVRIDGVETINEELHLVLQDIPDASEKLELIDVTKLDKLLKEEVKK